MKKHQMPRLFLIFLLLTCTVATQSPLLALASDQKQIIGWVEKVQLLPENILLHAKIDTGADHSSLNVTEIIEFIRHGERWVRFSFTPRSSNEVTLERKVYRFTKIKRKAAKSQQRPVILLELCLGGIYQPDVEVNLADRKNFKFNMLIGRSVLAEHFIVDSSLTYTQELTCRQPQPHE